MIRNALDRLRAIAAAYVEPLKITGEAVADLGRWTLDKAKAVVVKVKDVSPVTIVRKDEVGFNARWQDTEGDTK
jgi:hypothetical protein